MNVDMKKCIMYWDGKDSQSQGFYEQGRGYEIGRKIMSRLWQAMSLEERTTLVPRPGMEGESEAPDGGRSAWRKLMLLQVKC